MPPLDGSYGVIIMQFSSQQMMIEHLKFENNFIPHDNKTQQTTTKREMASARDTQRQLSFAKTIIIDLK